MKFMLKLFLLCCMCSCSIGGRYHLIQKGSQRTDDEMTISLRDFSGEISVSDSVVSTFTYTVSELQEKVMFLDVQFDGANPLSLKQQWIYMENRLMFGDSDSSTYYLVKIPPLTKRSDAIPDMCKKASSLCYTPYAQLYRLVDEALEYHLTYLKEKYGKAGPYHVAINDLPPGYQLPAKIAGERIVPIDMNIKRNFKYERRVSKVRVDASKMDTLEIRVMERFCKKKGDMLYVGAPEGMFTKVFWISDTDGSHIWKVQSIEH